MRTSLIVLWTHFDYYYYCYYYILCSGQIVLREIWSLDEDGPALSIRINL